MYSGVRALKLCRWEKVFSHVSSVKGREGIEIPELSVAYPNIWNRKKLLHVYWGGWGGGANINIPELVEQHTKCCLSVLDGHMRKDTRLCTYIHIHIPEQGSLGTR